ncbi:MAG: hypothetical protein FWD23_12265 [Oscillospiraceae bacterium]|nr:hypothetical protein [Oscillospiraceae bacterium]
MSSAKIKIKIEDVGNYLDAEKTANMLELVEFIRANKIGIQHSSGTSWSLRYKGKQFGSLHIHAGTWRFAHRGLEKYYEMEEGELKKFIFDNIYARTCGDCQWNPGAQKAGYMNPTGCGCWPLRIFNADGEVLENTKRLIEYRKNCLEESNI